jgi:hypothetical protein
MSKVYLSLFLIIVFIFTIASVTSEASLGDTDAVYRVVFDSTWSNSTHPTDNFPASAHYSPMVGATHSDGVAFWGEGTLATLGMEQMAEFGGTAQLLAEVNSAIGLNSANQTLLGSGLGSGSGMIVLDTISMTTDFPLVTLVTMVAPSPDWFVGVAGETLLDEQGNWVDEKVVVLYPYDAGTEDGDGYSTNNPATNPHIPIWLRQNIVPFSNEPLGTMTFTRLDVPHSESIYLPLLRTKP